MVSSAVFLHLNGGNLQFNIIWIPLPYIQKNLTLDPCAVSKGSSTCSSFNLSRVNFGRTGYVVDEAEAGILGFIINFQVGLTWHLSRTG